MLRQALVTEPHARVGVHQVFKNIKLFAKMTERLCNPPWNNDRNEGLALMHYGKVQGSSTMILIPEGSS